MLNLFISSNKKIILILVPILMLVGFISLSKHNLLTDEGVHFEQILRYINLDFRLHQGLTNIPGYHILIASLLKVFRLNDYIYARNFSMLLSSLIFFFTYKITKVSKSGFEVEKVFEVLFLPILWPLLFLIYTDALGLLLILIFLLLIQNKKYVIAGLIGLVSVLIRQTNICWVAFGALYIYVEHFNMSSSTQVLKKYLKSIWALILVGILFLLFVWWNEGIALGDRSMHPPFSMKLGNIEFFLFVFFVLYLPQNISNFRRVRLFLNRRKWLIYFIPILFFVFYFNMDFDHPYNNIGFDFFLRNKILHLTRLSTFFRMFFAVCCCYSVFSLIVTKHSNKSFYLMLVINMLLLSASWLVEQRYYIVGFVLFILLKEDNKEMIAYQIAYSAILTVVLWVGIIDLEFFL